MKQFVLQTVRPITFCAWLPPFVGSLLGGSLSWHTLTACLGTMLAVGLVNIHNNQTDRKIDRLNWAKDSLAVHRPLQNHQLIIIGGPALALLLRQVGYNYLLLSVLFYVGVFYNYIFGRVPVAKRIIVAAVVATTSFLAVSSPNPWVWLWTVAVGIFIYGRETGKDRADAQEDKLARFFRQAPIDWWCISAPFIGIVVYLATSLGISAELKATHAVVSLGTALTIFSVMQIRARHGWYQMWFPHHLIAGQSGLTLALAALMPPFATGILPIVVFNLTTIYARSCLPARANLKWWANLHDAYLWTSLIWLAMIGPGVFSLALTLVSIVLLIFVFVWEYRRTHRLALV